ncbi:hypothetical protein HDU91_002329 [Kappamyces sp. JEL0680]|nr:hypothetical protein HDU91_002329 [Kappamyces sp. JEL0680]
MSDTEDDVLETRTSYLDVEKEKLKRENKTGFTYLAVVVGQFAKDAERVEYSSHYQRFFKRHQTETDKITGILLLYRTSFLHVLEAPQKVMYAFLNDVASYHLQKDGQVVPGQARLLLLTDDTFPSDSQSGSHHQARHFPFWASKVIDSKDDSAPLDWSIMDEASVDDQISTLCIQLLQVGHSLSAMNKAFEDISEKYRGMIPTPTMTWQLAGLANVLSLSDWTAQYQGNMRVVLESEVVWPASQPLLFA